MASFLIIPLCSSLKVDHSLDYCYGSYEEYASMPEKYPPLSAAQIRKLKQLSIIDAAHHQKHIPYKSLFEKLGISSSRDLEDLIIELFYLEAITGKLDQQRAMLEVESAIGRDIREGQVVVTPELFFNPFRSQNCKRRLICG